MRGGPAPAETGGGGGGGETSGDCSMSVLYVCSSPAGLGMNSCRRKSFQLYLGVQGCGVSGCGV